MLRNKLSRSVLVRLVLIALLAAVPTAWWLWTAHAATRTWTGGGINDPNPPLRNLWTNPLNWSGGALPAAGDDLNFPSSVQQGSLNNFAAGTTFNSISISGGHAMQGNAVSLNSGITAATGGIFLSSIKLNNSQTFNAPTAGAGAAITSTIDTNGMQLSLDGPGGFNLAGVISGSGGLAKRGSGASHLQAANTYTGETSINGGALRVFGSQPNSRVRITVGTLGGTGTVGPVSFGNPNGVAAGTISPGAANNTTGILKTNGNVTFPTSTSPYSASFDIDLNGATAGSGHDQLDVTGTVFLDSLPNNNTLAVNLGFTPPPGSSFLIIKNDGTDPVVGAFSGKPEGSSFKVGGTTFFITYRGGEDGNDVVLHVPREWDGGGTDNNWMTAANWVGDVAPASGDYLIFPPGAARKGNINNFPADTNFGSITFSGDGYFINGSSITLSNGLIASAPSGSVSTFIPGIKLTQAQTFLSNSPSDLYGQLNLNGFQLTFDGSSNHTVSGNIVGAGGIVKNGSINTALLLSGGSSTYTGVTAINAGLLVVRTTNALGASGAGNQTIVATGASVTLLSNVKDIPETLFLNGFGQNSFSGVLVASECNLGCSISGAINLGSLSDTGIRTAGTGDRLTLDGVITGAPDQTLSKSGAGTLIINGTYAGPTDVSSGTLLVNGTIGNVRLLVTTLGGTGTVGALTGSGWVTPGTSPGILKANGNVRFGSHGTLIVELGGTTVGTQYDRVNVTGSVSLNSTTLDGRLINGFTPVAGNQFTIIQSTDTISGQFAQGNSVTFGGMAFNITYHPNSVVLTAVGSFPVPTVFVNSNNTSEAVALDSITFARGPFRTRSDHNFSSDHQTRVLLFTTNLGLSQADVSKVTVSAAGISLPVENVGPVTGVPGLDASYIVVRMPAGLPPGNHPLIVIANGVQSTNSPTLGIAP